MGMTPLMVAAARGGGFETGEEEMEDEGAAQVISDLVARGAQLNATMDKTGKFCNKTFFKHWTYYYLNFKVKHLCILLRGMPAQMQRNGCWTQVRRLTSKIILGELLSTLP